jgi:hypothetical protein
VSLASAEFAAIRGVSGLFPACDYPPQRGDQAVTEGARDGLATHKARSLAWHMHCWRMIMSRQFKGAAIAIAFVAAFIASIAFHSLIASVIVLLTGVTVSYVLAISWMRTSTHRLRDKPRSIP